MRHKNHHSEMTFTEKFRFQTTTTMTTMTNKHFVDSRKKIEKKEEIDEEKNNKTGVFLLESKRHLIDAILCLCAYNKLWQQRSSVDNAFTFSLICLFIQMESSRFYVHGTTLPLCHRPVGWLLFGRVLSQCQREMKRTEFLVCYTIAGHTHQTCRSNKT